MIPPLNLLCVVSNVINAITSLILGLTILLKNPRSKLHQLWWWMSLSITLWGTGLVIAFASLNNYALALFALRIADTVAIFIPLLYLHFIIVFLQRKDQGRLLKICYAASIILACFGFSPLYIPSMTTKMGIHNFNEAGPLFLFFGALYTFEPIYAIRLLWQAKQSSSGNQKALITYVLTAGVFGFLVGATWFPLCFNIPVFPIGGCFVWLYCLFVTWAVFKYQLFDIRVVIRKSLVYSILITILTTGYFGLVYGVERTLQVTFGYRSPWISLGSFAIMSLAFQPLKIGIQRFVDWLLFRTRQEEMIKRMERLEEEARQSEKLRAVATIAAGMAHEIKNPLTALQTFAEFVPEKHADPAFAKKLHEVLIQETHRIRGIVQDVLDFAKPKKPQIRSIDLRDLLNSTIDLLSGELLNHKVNWVIDCQHNGASVHADPDQLRQVLINLIQNAADAMPNGGTLSLATRNVNSHLELTVSDTGHGIPKELLPKIFDPFVTTKADGNGLGLAMVHSIIRAHGGTIHVESQLSAGTIFTVSFPL